jgi:hypothetical protein
MHTECPNENCGAIWGFDEMQTNQCYACGWPYNKDVEYDEDGADPQYEDDVKDPEATDDVRDPDPEDADYFKW